MRCGLDGNRLGSLHGFFDGHLQFLIGCNQRMSGLVFAWKAASDPSLWVSDWHLVSGLFL